MKKYFECYEREGHTVIEIHVDKLDLFETSKVLSNVEDELKKLGFPDVIIDLTYINTMDTSGVGSLIAIKNMLKKYSKEMVITGANETISKVFYMTKMNSFFKVMVAIEDAIDYFNSKK